MNEDYLNTCHGNNDKLVKYESNSYAIRYWSTDNCFEQSREQARERQKKRDLLQMKVLLKTTIMQ